MYQKNVSVKLFPPELEVDNSSTFPVRYEAGKSSEPGQQLIKSILVFDINIKQLFQQER